MCVVLWGIRDISDLEIQTSVSVVRQLNKWDIWSRLLKCLLAHSSCCEISDKLRSWGATKRCYITVQPQSIHHLLKWTAMCIYASNTHRKWENQQLTILLMRFLKNRCFVSQSRCYTELWHHNQQHNRGVVIFEDGFCLLICQRKGRIDTIFM